MADSSEQAGSPSNGSGGSERRNNTVLGFMLSNKVEAALWMTRVFTVLCCILFLLPIFGGNPFSYYQRALISNAATSALRLHQRLPNFHFSREFFGLLFMEDSCHYLFFSLIFMNSYPITMALVPVFLFAILHACNYTINILDVIGPNSMMFIRNLVNKLKAQQVSVLRFVACSEIFLMPALMFMMFSGRVSILLPVVYYRFLTLRYSSRRNPYNRTLFTELRVTVDYVCNKPQCPQLIRNICSKVIDLISRLAPQVPTQQ
ncbi:hypothetical protein ACJMK2_032871 [Sinanodonta woodiana]|uniref:Transmembrane protein 33 n=1 Tax=Sinanodonta woodiana TaxID=1069815 RepID=A0ABD3X3N5_SINWO